MVVDVAAGAYHSLALTSDGDIVGWGENPHDQISIPPGTAGHTVAIDSYGYTSAALLDDGSIDVWGDSSYGQTSNEPAGSASSWSRPSYLIHRNCPRPG